MPGSVNFFQMHALLKSDLRDFNLYFALFCFVSWPKGAGHGTMPRSP